MDGGWAKRLKFGLGGNRKAHMGYFWPDGVQDHFELIWCPCLKIAINNEPADSAGVTFTF